MTVFLLSEEKKEARARIMSIINSSKLEVETEESPDGILISYQGESVFCVFADFVHRNSTALTTVRKFLKTNNRG